MTNRNNKRKLGVLAGAIGLAFAAGALAQSGADSRAPGSAPPPLVQGDSARHEHAQRVSDDVKSFDDVADKQPTLTKFVAALKASGLEQSLTDGKEYTIFAPNNDALADKKGEDIDDLMKPENRQDLVGFMRAHIVADTLDLQSPRELRSVKTLDGKTFDIERKDGEIEIGDAKVVNANGLDWGNVKIYPIDDVLARRAKADDDKVSSSKPTAPRG
jgi:uncharacterized surface protein with fasciclin (FAS1) repeats